MPLRLSPDELQVLVNALEQRDRELMHEIVHTDKAPFKKALCCKQQMLTEIRNKLTGPDVYLSVDELKALSEVVDHSERELIDEIAHTDHRQFRLQLKTKEALLEKIEAKVTPPRAP